MNQFKQKICKKLGFTISKKNCFFKGGGDLPAKYLNFYMLNSYLN